MQLLPKLIGARRHNVVGKRDLIPRDHHELSRFLRDRNSASGPAVTLLAGTPLAGTGGPFKVMINWPRGGLIA